MQKLTKADKISIDELQGLITENLPPRERAVRQYVIDAFRHKMSTLIPFAFNNKSVLKLASYLLRHTTGSKATLFQYVFGIYRFSKWIDKSPDKMIKDSILDVKAKDQYIDAIDNFLGDLKAEELAPGTINNHIKGVKALFRTNGVIIVLPYRLSKRSKYSDRVPTPEELTKIIELADIREKVIISLLTLGSFRIGSLVKLQYRHVKRDLEKNRIPIHIHVEAEITKGKYHNYDTFIGKEAVEYLKAYLQLRQKGTWYIPPEKIEDETPLIRDERSKKVRPLNPPAIHRIVHNLFIQAGIIKKKGQHLPHRKKCRIRYEVRPHSLRKYFRTQLGAISTIPTDYIEYMMGHTISSYNDVKTKIELLRTLYASSGLSIRPKTKHSKVEQLKLYAEILGLDPHEYLSRKALSMPHKTIIDYEQYQTNTLTQALKQAILKELR
jgi:integrase